MAAPEYVPVGPDRDRYYASPPRRPESWVGARPGELDAEQPEGPAMGHQGPDQGYALRIVRHFTDRIHLTAGEHLADVQAGAVAIGLKRASLYGRAPVSHDIELALRIFGFLDADPPAALLAQRRELFEGVAHGHHYLELRRLAAVVPESTLRATPAQVADRYKTGWERLVDLEAAAH